MGYGDLTPTNPSEIAVILVIQIIGIATFAYAVNQIGVVLSNMRAKNEKIEKDLSNIEALGNLYRINS